MNAILLAGGQSSRFKSDKAMAKLDGQRLINRILCRLQEVFNRVYIIVNDKSNYSFLEGAQLVTDIIPDKGPLGGLYTGLQHSTAEYNYLAACDMPLITVDYLNFLKNIERDYDVLLPEYKDRLEPLAGIYTKSCCKLAYYLSIKH